MVQQAKMTNEKLYKETDSINTSLKIKHSRLWWLGHVPIRMSNERILTVAIGCMDSNWEKEIKKCRPKTTWQRTVMKELRGDGSKMERSASQSSGQSVVAKFNCGLVPAGMKRLSDRVSLIVLSVGSANESEPLNQNPWPLIKLFTTPEKEKTKIHYLNTLPNIWLSKLNRTVKFLISSKKENRICMTLKSNVKKGVSLSIHYLGSLFQVFRSCGRRKQM